MRASVLAKAGGQTVIEPRELPDPVPGASEVLLEIRAAALNHLDLYAVAQHRQTESAGIRTIGSDAAGRVAAVGSEVTTVAPGDEVVLNAGLSCGLCEFCRAGEESQCVSFDIVGRGRPGTFAEAVVVPAGNLAPKPDHLDFEAAAALSLDHLTAWRMLHTRGQLQSGDTVLIHGIGGGAALASLQLAKLVDARVIVTSSSGDKLERAGQLGADHLLDYRQQTRVAAEVRRLTEGRGADLVIDSVGAATLAESVSAVRNGGRVVVCGATTGAEAELNLREVFWRQVSVIGSTMGSRRDFREMLLAVQEHRLQPVIDSVWHLSDLEPALSRLAAAEQFGKIVLSAAGGSGCWP